MRKGIPGPAAAANSARRILYPLAQQGPVLGNLASQNVHGRNALRVFGLPSALWPRACPSSRLTLWDGCVPAVTGAVEPMPGIWAEFDCFLARMGSDCQRQ